MGKSKNRIIYRGKNQDLVNISRIDAIINTIELLKAGDKEAYSIITLFGLTAEELLENGAGFELVKGLENILK